MAQPISTDGVPPAWAVAGQVAGEKGGPPPSVKVAHVYVVLQYYKMYGSFL